MAILKSTNIFGTLKIHALTQSTSSTTGSLVVSGGVGINKTLHVGENLFVAGSTTTAKINGLTITPCPTSKILDLSVASFKSGYGSNTGSITVTSNSTTARTLTLGRDITLTGDAARTLTLNTASKTLAGAGTTLTFGGNFTTYGAHATTLTTTGTTTLTLPKNGTLVSSTDTGTVTNIMLAGSIGNNKLSNSTISGISLGSDLKSLTISTGLSGIAYNGSSDVTIAIDDTVVTLSGEQTLTNKKINDIKATAATTTADLWSEITTGSIAIGAGLTTGTLNIDASSTKAHVLNLGTGITGTALTKTINIGTRGASGSTTNINIGSATTGSINNTSIKGSLGVSGDTGIGGDLTVSGDLIVSGTTTTVNSTTVTIDDPVFTLGGDTAPTGNDSKDRGIEYRWHNGTTAKTGFFGYDHSEGKFTFIPDATNANEVFSGSIGTIKANLEGNVTGSVTGNADTATQLYTKRKIFGKDFDGTADITHGLTAGFAKFDSSGKFTTTDTNTYLTGNQKITLSGVISGSGTTSISTTWSQTPWTSYLPLTGGTVSGGITPNADNTIYLGSNEKLFSRVYTTSISGKSALPGQTNINGDILYIDAGYGSGTGNGSQIEFNVSKKRTTSGSTSHETITHSMTADGLYVSGEVQATSFNSITGLASSAPSNLAATAAKGSSTLAARQDHVHKLPTLSDLGYTGATNANYYTHPTHTSKSSGIYTITVNSLGHVSAATLSAITDNGTLIGLERNSKITGNLEVTGNISGAKVYGAVWNDIADFVEIDSDTEVEFGKAYFRNEDGKIQKTNKKVSSIGIASDTYGFGVGQDENKKQMPVAVGGWVLAFTKDIYKSGTAMVASENGILKKASILDKILFPERIIAIFDRAEKEEVWNGVEVKGRHWVKVK